MLTSILVYAALLPFVTAAVVVFVCGQLGISQRSAWAWGVALSFIATQIGLKSHNDAFAAAIRMLAAPTEAGDWLTILVLLALGTSLLLIASPESLQRYVLAIAGLFVVTVPLRLLSFNARLAQQWTAFEKISCLAFLAIALGLVWRMLATQRAGQSWFARLLLVIIVAAGAAIVLTLSGALSFGESSGALAAALGGAATISLLRHIGSQARSQNAFEGFTGAAGVIACALGGLIILGHFFSDLSLLNAVLLFASLAAAGGPLPKPMAEQPAWLQFAIRTLLCGTPLVIAIVSVLD